MRILAKIQWNSPFLALFGIFWTFLLHFLTLFGTKLLKRPNTQDWQNPQDLKDRQNSDVQSVFTLHSVLLCTVYSVQLHRLPSVPYLIQLWIRLANTGAAHRSLLYAGSKATNLAELTIMGKASHILGEKYDMN